VGPAYSPPNEVAFQRSKQGLSQERVARFLGITRETYSRVENGVVWPNPRRIRLLATVLSVDEQELVRLLMEAWFAAHPEDKP
jgi:transcriptional regulator with XRE-family HTH domain